jgi:ATP-dependent Clp protease protease subunit
MLGSTLKPLLIVTGLILTTVVGFNLSHNKNLPITNPETIVENRNYAFSGPQLIPATDNTFKGLNKNNTKIPVLKLPAERTVMLVGEVAANAMSAATQITSMAEFSKDPIYLILSGPGGSISMGSRVIAAIESSQAPVYTICDILCASMDAMIHQYGKKRYITSRSIMMFHPASGGSDGDIDRIYSLVYFIKHWVAKMETDIATRQGLTFEQYKAKTQTNLWLDSEESLEQGVSDGTVAYTIKGIQGFLNESSNGNIKSPFQPRESDLNVKWICKECMNGNYKWLTIK